MIVNIDRGKFRLNALSVKAICGLIVGKSMEIESLSVLAVFYTVLWGMGMKMIYAHIEHAVEKINMKTPALSLTDELKEEFYDLLNMALEDTVGNMKMPTAFDHALGAISSVIQGKVMKNMPSNIIEGLTHSPDHGSPFEEENNPPI